MTSTDFLPHLRGLRGNRQPEMVSPCLTARVARCRRSPPGYLSPFWSGGRFPWWWGDLKARFTSHPSQLTEKALLLLPEASPQPTEDLLRPAKPTALDDLQAKPTTRRSKQSYERRKTAKLLRRCKTV